MRSWCNVHFHAIIFVNFTGQCPYKFYVNIFGSSTKNNIDMLSCHVAGQMNKNICLFSALMETAVHDFRNIYSDMVTSDYLRHFHGHCRRTIP